jgi:NitT/TauT family transport system substrate-binding protein
MHRSHIFRWLPAPLLALALLAGLPLGSSVPSAAAADKIVYGMPGVPPVFVSVMPYVARDLGFYKKYGVDVELRAFESGAAATQAVVSGAIDAALSPTALYIKMDSNAGADVVGIMGHEHPDWLLGSMDPGKADCEHLRGQGVGVDSIGGARAIALQQMLPGCKMKIEDVQQVGLSSNVGAAMVAGQLVYGVLHIDDVPVIERESGKKLAIVKTLAQVNPGTHYITMVVRRDTIGKKHDALVRMLAAQIEAVRFMRDPANLDPVAEAAKVTGRSHEEAAESVKRYNAMEFWPVDNVGLSRQQFEKDVATQVKIGGIKPGKTPTPYEQLTDPTLFDEAMKLVKSR